MRRAAIAPLQDIEDARLNHHARRPVIGQLLQFPVETLAGMDDSGDEIVEALPLHRHHTFEARGKIVAQLAKLAR